MGRLRKLLIIFLLLPTTALAIEAIKLDTPQGQLVGALSTVNPDIRVFKGIPYALPPTGARRWQHAEPAGHWEGERFANQFSPECIQKPYPAGSFFSRPSMLASEDCLYLNVWSGSKAGDKQPVMVWIHGGGLTRGTGATMAYDGARLASKGVVLVTINYRLDVLGYFNHPELTDSDGQPMANFGTTDQTLALRWVQDNISAFGGDPTNVTIFGESAGSFSVNHLMATPLARGLFHRAIGQSGSAMGPMQDLRDKDSEAHRDAITFQQTAGASSLADLKRMDAQHILASASKTRFRPAIDGRVFPEEIYKLFDQGKYNAVPLMVGFNAHEGTTLGVTYRIPKNEADYTDAVKKRYGALANEFLEHYPASNLRASTLDAYRDGFVTWGMQSWAMKMASSGQPAYLYYFSFEPAGPELGAYHAAEIVYAFDNVSVVNPEAEVRHTQLADLMSDYWVNFARHGNPNANGLADWKAYSAKNRHYMEFDGNAIPGKDLLPGIWEFQEKLRNAR